MVHRIQICAINWLFTTMSINSEQIFKYSKINAQIEHSINEWNLLKMSYFKTSSMNPKMNGLAQIPHLRTRRTIYGFYSYLSHHSTRNLFTLDIPYNNSTRTVRSQSHIVAGLFTACTHLCEWNCFFIARKLRIYSVVSSNANTPG